MVEGDALWGPYTHGTLGDRLHQGRRRRFVGRSEEIKSFSRALDAPGEFFTVLFVHGPGGVGKSALLGELAEAAQRAGVAPVRLDAQIIQPSPSSVEGALGIVDGRAPSEALGGGRHVILFDGYELLAPIDDWVRERLLPGLPSETLVVIAGRRPPSARWMSDPGWRDLLRVVPLRNLSPTDTRTYLRIEGLPDALHEQVLTLTHGHPLTLSLLVDAILRDAGQEMPQVLADAPDLVRALLGQIVDEAPSPRHRKALEVCAHARFTTEDVLRVTLGGQDSHELFDWLRTLSFVEEGAYGLSPHDVARDVLEADLRWRDREDYADLHRRIRRYMVERIRQANERDRHRLVGDLAFLSRMHPVTSAHTELSSLDQAYLDVLRPAEIEPIIAMTREAQGDEQAALAAYWIERQPQAFGVFHTSSGEPIGYAAYLALHEAGEADLATDPGARAMWEYANRHGPPRADEQVMAWRFAVDTEEDRRPSRSQTLFLMWWGHQIITHTRCAWDLCSAAAKDRAHFDLLRAHFDFHRAPEAAYEIGGRSYDVYAHDWRRLGVDEWLEMLVERELGAPPTEPTGAAPGLVLSEAEFADAVRAALHDLHRPDRLTGNPLLRSRVVRERGGTRSEVETLRELIGEAAAALRADPRKDALHQVIDRTFLHPAPTQERAAELLGLPFSTYRRYRNRGAESIAAWLWHRELYGPEPNTEHQPAHGRD